MTQYNDPRLAFEHALREHVRQCVDYCNAVYQAHKGNDYSVVDVRFDPADGGKWTISAYNKGASTNITGAELDATCREWVRTFTAQNAITGLRSLLPAPTPEVSIASAAAQQDEIATFGNDAVEPAPF